MVQLLAFLLSLGHELSHSISDFLWGEFFLDGHDRPDVYERVFRQAEAVAPERVLGRHDGSSPGIHCAFVGDVHVVDVKLQDDAGPTERLR